MTEDQDFFSQDQDATTWHTHTHTLCLKKYIRSIFKITQHQVLESGKHHLLWTGTFITRDSHTTVTCQSKGWPLMGGAIRCHVITLMDHVYQQTARAITLWPAITRAWLTDNSQKPTCWCHTIRSNLQFINNNGSVKPRLVQAALDCPVFYRPHCTIEQPVWYAVNSSGLARACIVVLLLVTTQLTCMRCKVRCKSWCLHVNRSM